MSQYSIFRDSTVVKNIIYVNVLLYLLTILLYLTSGINLEQVLGMHYMGSIGSYKPWQLLTHFFMHSTLVLNEQGKFMKPYIYHILFNMFALFTFGNILEKIWGPKRFLFFYMFCGFGAAIVHEMSQAFQVYQAFGSLFIHQDIGITLGASGAIFGLLSGFAILFPNTELQLMFIPVPIKAKFLIGGFILIDLIGGFTGFSLFSMGGGNIAHFAHLGGAVFGAGMVLYWKKTSRTFF